VLQVEEQEQQELIQDQEFQVVQVYNFNISTVQQHILQVEVEVE
jgi:hypothetical protein